MFFTQLHFVNIGAGSTKVIQYTQNKVSK